MLKKTKAPTEEYISSLYTVLFLIIIIMISSMHISYYKGNFDGYLQGYEEGIVDEKESIKRTMMKMKEAGYCRYLTIAHNTYCTNPNNTTGNTPEEEYFLNLSKEVK